MQSYDNIINFLFNNNIDRKYTTIGLGGGIIGDITGFVASTFTRRYQAYSCTHYFYLWLTLVLVVKPVLIIFMVKI